LPTKTGRKILLDINLKDEKVDENLDWETLLSKTEGFSGADIYSLCREAAMFPLRRKLKEEGGLQKLSEQAI
jgi:katanin p60 ATPase-containing subunit A1